MHCHNKERCTFCCSAWRCSCCVCVCVCVCDFFFLASVPRTDAPVSLSPPCFTLTFVMNFWGCDPFSLSLSWPIVMPSSAHHRTVVLLLSQAWLLQCESESIIIMLLLLLGVLKALFIFIATIYFTAAVFLFAWLFSWLTKYIHRGACLLRVRWGREATLLASPNNLSLLAP